MMTRHCQFDKHNKRKIGWIQCKVISWLMQMIIFYWLLCYHINFIYNNLLYNANQLLFTTTLFRDLSKMMWFAAKFFRDIAVSTLVLILNILERNWFAARSICNSKTLTNLPKISSTRIKVGWFWEYSYRYIESYSKWCAL